MVAGQALGLGVLAVAWPPLVVISPFRWKVLWTFREANSSSLTSFFGDWLVEKALEEVVCGRFPRTRGILSGLPPLVFLCPENCFR